METNIVKNGYGLPTIQCFEGGAPVQTIAFCDLSGDCAYTDDLGRDYEQIENGLEACGLEGKIIGARVGLRVEVPQTRLMEFCLQNGIEMTPGRSR